MNDVNEMVYYEPNTDKIIIVYIDEKRNTCVYMNGERVGFILPIPPLYFGYELLGEL